MADLIVGLGVVAVVEGLALAIAPGRVRAVLEALDALAPDRRRALGLAAVAVGVLIIWLARG